MNDKPSNNWNTPYIFKLLLLVQKALMLKEQERVYSSLDRAQNIISHHLARIKNG